MESNRTNLHKIKYDHKYQVKRAIKDHLEKYGQEMRAYRCKCDRTIHYHLTSSVDVKAVLMKGGEIIEEIY